MVQLDRELAWAAATDAANRSMRRAGRAVWSHEDYQVACAVFERLCPIDNDRHSASAIEELRMPSTHSCAT